MNLTKVWWFVRTKLLQSRYASVGKHSYVGKPLYIQRKGIIVGNNVRIYPGMRAELTCQDAKIIIEDNVSIGQNFHVVCYKGNLIIGRDSTISGNVFVSNVDHAYENIGIHILDQEMIYKETVIGKNCYIGYGATILPGSILGRQCIVGANSVVKGIYPDFSILAGNPARIIRKFDIEKEEWIKVK